MAFFNSVSDLKPFKSMWKIKVKIIRLWKQYYVAGGETIEMVLIDSKGDKISASVKKDLVKKLEPFFAPDGTMILINFSLNYSCGSYRTTKQLPNKLTGFELVNYIDVLSGTLNPDYLIDVIGQIVEVTYLEVVPVNGKDTSKLTCELRNIDASNASINVSVVTVNPKMLAVESCASLLSKDDLPFAIVDANPLVLVNGVSDKDDFFIHTPRKTICEVLESKKDYISEVERCIVMSTLSATNADMGWYYVGCKTCDKKVLAVPRDDFDEENPNDVVPYYYHCGKCKIDNPKLLPRYRILCH
ncbi:hypothetical protein EUTSA_v10009292mg [Eutrema salsugineum]|uniref:Replication protein A 70 kDa DNA-binding subunit B/D first OB fold domain-containing protein n=1 Tax=Eutrema salsugineum TaxID=72664 RepID=V4KQP8_EUTSA|nr:hypothetical protein EUTSA_v10009292mg [Eutrema salsugineum]